MSKQYDALVIGAGHNGLACAAKLARAGKKVMVVEANAELGGLAATTEFAEGFKASVAHTLPQLTDKLVKDLELHKHGFSFASEHLETLGLKEDGSDALRVTGDTVTGVSQDQVDAYKRYSAQMQKFAKAIAAFWQKKPPMIGDKSWASVSTGIQFGLNLRLLGKTDMREFTRMIALPAQDVMDEQFEDEHLKAVLAWDYTMGNKLAPRSPNNAMINWLYRLAGDASGFNKLPIAKGGMKGLIDALAASATSAGAVIKTNAAVKKVVVDEETATAVGVELADGEVVHAKAIISNADPKTSFIKLLGTRYIDIQFTHRINRTRTDGQTAKMHIAIKGEPKFNGVSRADGRMIIAPKMSYIENAFDSSKYGEIAQDPAMEIVVPTMHDASLAPEGHHVISITIPNVPYKVKAGWETEKANLQSAILNKLEAYAPGIKDQIVASDLLTPVDLESRYNVTGGHWHHGELALDAWWMNRPTYEASQYKTPIDGFYLCGAGAHPGGGVMGAAGSNAADVVLAASK